MIKVGSRTGSITQWDDAIGRGLITEDPPQVGVHVVSAKDSSASLLAELRGRAIPPSPPVPVRVSFDLTVTNEAINTEIGGEAIEINTKGVHVELQTGSTGPK
jgi:hypothetical protein